MICSRRILLAWSLALPVIMGQPALAEIAHVYAPGGVAIAGYDPVAYFTDGRAVPGSAEFMLKWRGAIWMFSSPSHMEAFEMDPLAYAPQYGGYCSVAIADGQVAGSDPQAFAIFDGRLYLNYNQNVLRLFQSNRSGFVARADLAWHDLSGR